MQFGTCEAGVIEYENNSLTSKLVIGADLWSPLQLYSIYRLILAGIILVLGMTQFTQTSLDPFEARIFSVSSNSYLVFSVFCVLTTHFRKPNFSTQLFFQTIIDISFLLSIIYANEGLNSGLGVLLLLPVILPSVLQPGRAALILAIATVIALLFVEVMLQLNVRDRIFELFHIGVLSVFIVIVSWLTGSWFERASRTAELAKRRGIDLANLSQLNQSILDQLQTGILVLDQRARIKHLNPTAWDMLGQPDNWRDQKLMEFAPELNAHLKYWLEKVSPKVVSYDIKHWRTTEFTMRLSQLGIKNQGMVLMYVDDTRLQREKLQDVKMASLGQLTANIAHEIRNPLGAISHAAQLLSESPVIDEADERMIQIIQSNSKRMNGTIESVLNLSRKSNPKRENICLKLWLEEFINDFIDQSSLKEDQINFYIDVSKAHIQFDPTHFHQVMWNLCRNAEKYAKENVADLHVDIQGSHPRHTRDIMLNIIDNGKGIPRKNVDRLFEPFFTTSTKGDDGTGLGLFMARELCLSNGATLDYVKLPSGGSCFRIVFSQTTLDG